MSMPSVSHDLRTVEQVRAIEHAALQALGITGEELMHRAASAALSSLRRHWPRARRICVHCGPGNNGGDGFLLAVLARAAGLHVIVVAVGKQSHGDAAAARTAWLDGGGKVQQWDANADLPEAEVHVDALYGIGLNRAPEPLTAGLIEQINRSGRPVLALDVPSGLDSEPTSGPRNAIAIVTAGN